MSLALEIKEFRVKHPDLVTYLMEGKTVALTGYPEGNYSTELDDLDLNDSAELDLRSLIHELEDIEALTVDAGNFETNYRLNDRGKKLLLLDDSTLDNLHRTHEEAFAQFLKLCGQEDRAFAQAVNIWRAAVSNILD